MIAKILIYICLFLIEAVVSAIIFSPDFVKRELTEEQYAVAQVLGPRVELSMREESAEAFRKFFVNTGIVRASYDMLVPTEDQRRKSLGMEELGSKAFTWIERRLNSFWNAVYQMFYRLTVLVAWAPSVLPLAIPAVIDGLSIREVKKVSYGYASPVRYHAMTHAIVFLVMAIPIYLAFPLSVTPLIIPLWAVMVTISLMVFTANIQKRL